MALGMDDQEKARLTTWIVNQNAKGAWLPEITREIVDYAKGVPPLPTYERANRLLRWIASRVESVGYEVVITSRDPEAFAWSESVKAGEIEYFLRYLQDQAWVTVSKTAMPKGPSYNVLLTVEGYRQIEAQVTNALSNQGFVAMWFHNTTDDASENGIEQAIRDVGYEPMRIDKKNHANKIDNEIIAEIRKSKFVVADFTHGDDGARGGVYFEAGFALGLEIPVIYTCRRDQLDDLHFDTRQYPHILWETPEDLRAALAHRIGALLGQGQGSRTTS